MTHSYDDCRGPTRAKLFDLIPFDSIAFSSAPAYLFKGLLPRVDLAVMWGPPKCGKRFIAFDMMMSVALGWRFRDRRVQQGAVVYCALEGVKARVEAFRAANLADDVRGVPFFLSPTPLGLIADHQALAGSIQAESRRLVPPPLRAFIDYIQAWVPSAASVSRLS